MRNDLVFDIGLHEGQDTEFYLKKGFRVVAVDANAELCAAFARSHAAAVADGRLTIVNKAMSDRPGTATFYANAARSDWGTLNPEWVDRNRRLGTESTAHEVEATTMAELIAAFGTPYYAKIDIEGYDVIAVKGLRAVDERPKYVSIESDKVSFSALRQEFDLFASLGYDRFRIVNGLDVVKQRQPNPPKEGRFADHAMVEGASGLFGEELPGPWLTSDEAIEAYKPIFLSYAFNGDDPLISSPLVRGVLRKIGFRASWYDTHARRAD